MKGDFSRWTFRPAKHGVGLLHQQGRVWLDADWNEDTATRLELLREETVDIVGSCGVPEPGTAFRIEPNPDPNSAPDDFVIVGGRGPAGHAYVGGLLCKLERSVTYLTQPDFPDPPRIPLPAPTSPVSPPGGPQRQSAVVYLEAWQRLVTYLEDDELREIALGGPDTAARLQTVAQVKVLPVDGRGLSCESAGKLLPGAGRGTLSTLPPVDAQPPDPCRIPDPGTYTGRENHLYRVEIHDGGDVRGATGGASFTVPPAASVSAGATQLTLANALAPAQLATLLKSRLVTVEDDQGRLELLPVHAATATSLTLSRAVRRGFLADRPLVIRGGIARFKWSRDNAAFAVRALEIRNNRQTLALDSLGRDQITALRAGDLVEICDDASELGPARGHLTRLTADPDPDLLTVTLADPLPAEFRADRHLVVRRWDGWGWCAAKFDEAQTPDMNLGDGVRIQFGGADLRPGDHWVFAARSADGSIERLTEAPPLGIERRRCVLAVVEWATEPFFGRPQILVALRAGDLNDAQIAQVNQLLGDAPFVSSDAIEQALRQINLSPQRIATIRGRLGPGTPRTIFRVLSDCRDIFPPLTGLTHLHYVSGDGQETTPGGTLPRSLQAAVVNGTRPVVGAQVQFRITAGNGILGGGGAASASVIVVTGPDGVAECAWQLDQGTPSQQVEASLVGQTTAPVRYNAGFARGGQSPPRAEPCELTVGEGGDFRTLDEAVAALRERQAQVWCLCLLPGTHTLADDLDLRGLQAVTIGSCGQGAILNLQRSAIIASDLRSITLRGFAIGAEGSRGLVFQGCQQVLLESLAFGVGDNPDASAITCEGCQRVHLRDLGGEFSRLRSIVELNGNQFIYVERCVMAGLGGLLVGLRTSGDHRLLQLSHNTISVRADQAAIEAAVLVIGAARAGQQQTTLDGNTLRGAVSLYGEPARAPLREADLAVVNRRLSQGQVRLEPFDAVIQARGNRFTRLTIGDQATARLREGEGGVLAVYSSFLFGDNVVDDGDSVLLAARHALTANHFTEREPSRNLARFIGAVIGVAASFAANHGENPDLGLACAAPRNPPGGDPRPVEGVMNQILIRRL